MARPPTRSPDCLFVRLRVHPIVRPVASSLSRSPLARSTAPVGLVSWRLGLGHDVVPEVDPRRTNVVPEDENSSRSLSNILRARKWWCPKKRGWCPKLVPEVETTFFALFVKRKRVVPEVEPRNCGARRIFGHRWGARAVSSFGRSFGGLCWEDVRLYYILRGISPL